MAAVLQVPAVLFVGANLLKYGLGVDGLSDALGPFAEPTNDAMDAIVTAVVLIGPIVALLLSLVPITRFRFGRRDGALEARVVVRMRWSSIAVAIAALGVLLVLGSYTLAENSECWFGAATAC